jgi:hypothetical protein
VKTGNEVMSAHFPAIARQSEPYRAVTVRLSGGLLRQMAPANGARK